MRSLSLLLGLTLAAFAAQADELQRCAQIAESAARLACYDSHAAAQRALPAAAPAVVAPTGQQRVDAFGVQPVAPKDQLDRVESRVDGVVEGWQAGSVFQLANGQRWMVADGSRATLFLRSPKVTISRGAMGTFWIQFEGSNQAARVKRL